MYPGREWPGDGEAAEAAAGSDAGPGVRLLSGRPRAGRRLDHAGLSMISRLAKRGVTGTKRSQKDCRAGVLVASSPALMRG